MANALTDLLERTRLASRSILEFGSSAFKPTIRLGVTGLSRAGKTVFITALVHALLRGGRLPVFEAWTGGRIARVSLTPQPDDVVPRFAYEAHLAALVTDRRWPESTRQISELRLIIDYQSKNGSMRQLTLDIVDYPGEWLLDLPLLQTSYEDWSLESLRLSRQPIRAELAADWHACLRTLDPLAPENEQTAQDAARRFTDYLRACRDDRFALSLLPPGRFLMPGDLADSPALTFVPLDTPPDRNPPPGSLWAMMRRRYEAYKDGVVRPFFRDHFVRLDRQLVLVDALAALNAGPSAVHDLETALTKILECFNVGKNNFLTSLFAPRIDRVLFAATKADLLHHTTHDKLEAILRRMVTDAVARASFSGTAVDVVALAAVRATREASVKVANGSLKAIIGTPIAGEVAGDRIFDGNTDMVIHPGELPDDPDAMFSRDEATFRGLSSSPLSDVDYRFLRLRPPVIEPINQNPALPHIRLDRTLEFLIGDRLR